MSEAQPFDVQARREIAGRVSQRKSVEGEWIVERETTQLGYGRATFIDVIKRI